ncbi:uncharacterized protein ATNIH1004_005625 [Aspergillus tanneri]|uniref:Myb-like domain-containing protein n=1 Tax=Aspergillus tanneri TaxID=1220188 RepID=A0A5M9MM16_9EURO|nr:uncharacterized protein ATNIH1004_005625 [Aspergillus tanneri]KAA8646946.1 hypothetical protein ATNIH1004_005625 [Aspergillus tanneri]
MSSASLYKPEEDDSSDPDFDTEVIQIKAHPSSSPAKNDGQNLSELIPRANRGTRSQALECLRRSLTKESVEAYANLLDECVDLAAGKSCGENYNSIQDGIVIWKPKEKDVLFSLLGAKGKNGIREIARAIGTKSELEVQEHLRLLHRGLERQHLRDQHTRTVILGDIPAATELSKSCCNALEEYAELLRLEEQVHEDVAGRKKHKNLWIIDQETADKLDKEIQSQDDNVLQERSAQHTASLLSMPNWIRLSERFFMNFAGPRLADNWVNVAVADETPSVTADAFADFCALTVSVTRRLVQSVIFFAMSRHQHMRNTGHRKARVIKSRDVRTALKVLNMKRDRFGFWVGLARRCNLEVADIRHRKGWKSVYMDYDEVEEILSDKARLTPEPGGRSASRHRSKSRISHVTEGDDADTGSDSDEFLSSPALSSDEEPLPLDEEDEHAEQVDQKVNHMEELHLWTMLDQSSSVSLNPPAENNKEDVTRRPTGKRKTPEDLVNWRDRTLYRGDWEEYGHGIFDVYKDLSKNRQKRRRLNQRAYSPNPPDPSDNETSEASFKGVDLDSNTVGNEQDDKRNPSDGESDDAMEVDEDEPSHNIRAFHDLPSPLEEEPSSGPANGSIHLFEDDEVLKHEPTTHCSPNYYSSELFIPYPEQEEPESPFDTFSWPKISASPMKMLYPPINLNPYSQEQEHQFLTSSSDNGLSTGREKMRESSDEEDDKEGVQLYSQPMSPIDLLSE